MKPFYLILLPLLICSEAALFSSLATTSLALLSVSKPAFCFFGIFRRRRPTVPPIPKTPPAPEGPVAFPPRNFPAGFQNQFGGFGAGGNFYPGFGSPAFGGGMDQNMFQPQQPFRASQFPPSQFSPQTPHQQFQQQNFPSMPDSDNDPFRDMRSEDEGVPGMNTEEAESFFTLLAETDESKCISRLVCEMGANPDSGGEFGQTIGDIIGSLTNFPSGSKVSEYKEVLKMGKEQGLSACLSRYSSCDEESYQLVKKAQVDGQNEA